MRPGVSRRSAPVPLTPTRSTQPQPSLRGREAGFDCAFPGGPTTSRPSEPEGVVPALEIYRVARDARGGLPAAGGNSRSSMPSALRGRSRFGGRESGPRAPAHIAGSAGSAERHLGASGSVSAETRSALRQERSDSAESFPWDVERHLERWSESSAEDNSCNTNNTSGARDRHLGARVRPISLRRGIAGDPLEEGRRCLGLGVEAALTLPQTSLGVVRRPASRHKLEDVLLAAPGISIQVVGELVHAGMSKRVGKFAPVRRVVQHERILPDRRRLLSAHRSGVLVVVVHVRRV